MTSLHSTKARLSRIAVLAGSVLIALLTGCTGPASTAPPTSVTPPPAAASSASPVDTTNWIAYTSKRYGFSLKHPPGWLVKPAKRDWTLKADAGHLGSGAHEGFLAPGGDLYVAVWSTLAKDTPETLEGVGAWVEEYCRQAGDSCAGAQDRSEPLCNERRDCHPGLLVRFEGPNFRAFFTDGNERIVGVDVGRPEWHESLEKYGGARALLIAFLATMDVCPVRPDTTPPGCPR